MTSAFPIPLAALDSDVAILGRKGGGKTITAKGIVERLLEAQRRVLILDPLGGWTGLRTLADGKQPGFPVAIIGGERADYPLDLALAVPLADVLARENVPTIIDLSDVTKSAQQRFLVGFLRELRRVNRNPLTIVLEEADVFAPQNPLGDDSKELHAELDWIARRGRARGFRLITICQRPARLSKDVLTQASVLVAHTLPAPQDRDAVRAWVEGNGDRELSRKVFDTLADLKTGEAWIWSTVEGESFLKRSRFPMIRTLDTTSTPKAGQARIEQKKLADVDVSAIKAALEAAKAPKAKPEVNRRGPGEVDAVTRAAAITVAEERGYRSGYRTGYVTALREVKEAGTALWEACHVFRNRITEAAKDMPEAQTQSAAVIVAGTTVITGTVRRASSGGNNSAAAKMLAVLDTDPPVARTWTQVATLAGIKARGGHFNTGKKELLESGRLSIEGDLIRIVTPSPSAKSMAGDGVDRWCAVLSGAAPQMLRTLAQRSLSREELGEALGMAARGGHWNTGLKQLRENGLIIERGGLIEINRAEVHK